MSIRPQTGKLYDNLCCQGHLAEVLTQFASVDGILIQCQNEQCPNQGDENLHTQSLTLQEFTVRYRSGLVGTWGVYDHSDNTWWIGFDGDLLTFDSREDAQELAELLGDGLQPKQVEKGKLTLVNGFEIEIPEAYQ